MTIEAKIGELTTEMRALRHAIEALTEAMGDRRSVESRPAADEQPEAAQADPPASAPAVEAGPEEDVSYDDVKRAVLDLAKTRGRDAAVEVLESFGVSKATELKPEQYAAALKALRAAMEG